MPSSRFVLALFNRNLRVMPRKGYYVDQSQDKFKFLDDETLRSKVISLAFDVSLAAVIKKAKTSDTRADKRDEISQKGMAAVTVKTRMNFRMIELEDDCRMAPLVGEVIPKYLAYLVIQMSHFGK